MRTLKLTMVLCALGSAVFAEKPRTEVQQKVDAAMAQACGVARRNVLANKVLCAEEAAVLEPIDCAVREARDRVDFFKLDERCTQKQRKQGGQQAGRSSAEVR